MKSERFARVLAGLMAITGISAAHAEVKECGSVLRGAVESQQAGKNWTPSHKLVAGQWVRSMKNDTTMQVGKMTLRAESGTRLRFRGDANGVQHLDARGGRVYVRLAEDGKCFIATANKQVRASAAEFVLDAGDEQRLYVVEGSASLVDSKPTLPKSVTTWSKAGKSVAAEGPDVRRRAKTGRFTEGEENRGRRIGEDEPTSTPTETPAETETPAYTPTSTYTPPVSPSPTAPPEPPAEPLAEGGGIAPQDLILALLGAGGLTAAILLIDGDDDDDIIIPASP